MSKEKIIFTICVSNTGYEDLEIWKIYRVLHDTKATEVGCLRVVDESGEDYLYPQDRFVAIAFPKNVRDRLLAVSTQ